MNITNQSSPNFKMNVKGLDHPYFKRVPQILKDEILNKASKVTTSKFDIEFIPLKDNWVFLKKTIGNRQVMVDYFPAGFTPSDVAHTFYHRGILPNYVMAKCIINEINSKKVLDLYNKHVCNV